MGSLFLFLPVWGKTVFLITYHLENENHHPFPIEYFDHGMFL